MESLLPHWISLGLGLCLLYLPPLWQQESIASRLIAACVGALALVQLHVLLATINKTQPVFFALHEIALFAVAPLLYLGVESLRGEDISRTRIFRHLTPTLLAVPIAALQFIQPEFLYASLQPLYFAAFAIGSVYMLGVFRHLGHFTHPARLVRLETALLLTVVVTGAGVALLALLGLLFAQPAFNLLYGSAITGLLVLFHFLRLAYPELTQVVADELREAAESEGQSRRSQLGGVDVSARLVVLKDLMERQRLYRREDLDLATVAAAAGLSSHQLSELVNEHLGLNFSRWLKQYRVAEARELLVAKPALSVLEVGLAVGFNSLSSFYSAFREVEGMAPGMYRKQQRKPAQHTAAATKSSSTD